MRFIQYYNKGILSGEYLIEACGDRAVIIVDGRGNMYTTRLTAIQSNGINRPAYDGFAIFQGESILRSERVSPIYRFVKE